MLKFAADENFDSKIVAGLLRRNPQFDVVRIQDAGLHEEKDREILAWAAKEGRIILTHDLATMPLYAWNRVADGKEMPGLLAVPRPGPRGQMIEDILLIDAAADPEELAGRVQYLPL